MTHPMYQQQPQQGYAPQQYQQPPQGYGQQQQYAPQPYGQPVGGQSMPTSAPALGTSSRTGEGGPKFPQPRHLVGRTVIFEPIRIDETHKNDDGELRPMAHYHLTVVDGGPLEYGDNKSQKIADQHGYTMRTEVPARFVSCSSDRWGIVQEVRDAMARGEMATVGVIVQGTRGTKGSPPFLVTRPGTDLDGKERPDGDQRFQTATAVWNAIFAKTFRSPEPVSLVAPPAQQPPQVAYQPTAPPQGYPYGGAAQPLAQQQPQFSGYNTNAAPGFQTPYAAANPGTGPYGDGPPAGYQPQAYTSPAPITQAAQQFDAAPNPAFEAWLATLPPEQRAAYAPPAAGPGF